MRFFLVELSKGEYILTTPRRTISLSIVKTICTNVGVTLWFEKKPYKI
jgi:hypothetical protein